jgi:hypothetical protein
MKSLAALLMLFFSFAATAQDSTLKEYVGKYSFPDGSPVTAAEVVLNGSELSVTSTAGASVLEKRGKDTFYLQAFDGLVYFQRNTTGKVSGLKVDVQGNVFEGTKDAVATRNRNALFIDNRRSTAK